MPFPKPEPRARVKARQDRRQQLARRACVDAVWRRASIHSDASWALCEWCNQTVFRVWATDRPLQVGHVHELTPRSVGGDPTDPTGCVLLCVSCHAKAHKQKVRKEWLT